MLSLRSDSEADSVDDQENEATVIAPPEKRFNQPITDDSSLLDLASSNFVIPAQVGTQRMATQFSDNWASACTGVTTQLE